MENFTVADKANALEGEGMEEGTVVPPNRIVESSGNAPLTLLKTNKKKMN